MRKGRKSAAEEPGQKGGRALPHLGPGVRQAIEGDELYLVSPRHVRRVRRRARGDDWEVTLDPPVNVVLPVSRSALGACGARSAKTDVGPGVEEVGEV
jgi:hypothetical protein